MFAAAASDIKAMNTATVFQRFWRRAPLATSAGLRVEVGPPSLQHAPDTPWQRLMCWLLADSTRRASTPLHRMPAVRKEFLAALNDIGSSDAATLRGRIGATRSLRELWHLRAEIYRVVGLAHRQSEAQTRLALLNRHFPTRAPKSQFGAL